MFEKAKDLLNVALDFIKTGGEITNALGLKGKYLFYYSKYYLLNGNLIKAKKMIRQAYNTSFLVYDTYNLAQILLLESEILQNLKGNFQEYLRIKQKALRFASESGSKYLEGDILYQISKIYYENKELESAKKNINEAIKKISQTEYNSLLEKYNKFAQKIDYDQNFKN